VPTLPLLGRKKNAYWGKGKVPLSPSFSFTKKRRKGESFQHVLKEVAESALLAPDGKKEKKRKKPPRKDRLQGRERKRRTLSGRDPLPL